LKTLVSNIVSNDIENETKIAMTKRVVNDYITKDLKLNFDKIEFVNKLGEKLLPNHIEVLVGETIDKCIIKINQEIALLNSVEEEI